MQMENGVTNPSLQRGYKPTTWVSITHNTLNQEFSQHGSSAASQKMWFTFDAATRFEQALVIDLNSHCSDGLKSSLNQPRLSWPLSSCWRWQTSSSQVENEVPVLRLTHCSQIATWHGAADTDCPLTCVHSAPPDLGATASWHREIYHASVRERSFTEMRPD